MPDLPAGQRDYSSVRLSRHALERFVERFAAEPERAPKNFARRVREPADWAQYRKWGDRCAGDLPRAGTGGHRAAGKLPDRDDLEPVCSPARRVRPHEIASQVGSIVATAGWRDMSQPPRAQSLVKCQNTCGSEPSSVVIVTCPFNSVVWASALCERSPGHPAWPKISAP